MSIDHPPADVTDVVLGLARAGDRRSIAELLDGLARRGTGVADLVDQVAVPVLRAVGDLWLCDEWGIADEHLATGAVRDVLGAVTANRPRPGRQRGRVAVACATGEWHSAPAELFTDCLENAGWDAFCIGPSAPAEEVVDTVERLGVTALVVTCSTHWHYDGAALLAASAHERGVPVLVGGDAVTRHRIGPLLGADTPAVTRAEALAALAAWRDDPPSTLRAPSLAWPPEATPDVMRAAAAAARLDLARAAGGAAPSVDDLALVVRSAVAAAAVGRPAVLGDALRWHQAYLTARRFPPSTLRRALAALRRHLPGELEGLLVAPAGEVDLREA